MFNLTPYLFTFALFMTFFLGAVFGKKITNMYHTNHKNFKKGFDYKTPKDSPNEK